MSAPTDGGTAFPCEGGPESGLHPGPGMSLRDYFASHAPPMPEQWFLDSPRKKSDPLWHWGEASAVWAYFYADAMIAARGAPADETEARRLLDEVLAVLERGGDFQLGPKGAHRDLTERIRTVLR